MDQIVSLAGSYVSLSLLGCFLNFNSYSLLQVTTEKYIHEEKGKQQIISFYFEGTIVKIYDNLILLRDGAEENNFQM